MSLPLKMHSFLSKTTICRSPPPYHPPHLVPTIHYLWAPTNPPPLGHNHSTTPVHQLTHHSPHLTPTNPPPLTPITPSPMGTNPSPLNPNHPSASTRSSSSTCTSTSTNTSTRSRLCIVHYSLLPKVIQV